LDDAEIIRRLSGRRVCRGCGATFHVEYEKPKVDGVCDKCQGELYQRTDDSEEVIAHRLSVYAEQTKPIIDFYRAEGLLISIPAVGEVSEIFANAVAALA
jgi:adenylate kinase